MSELHFDITGNNENLLAKLQQTQNALRQTAQVAEQEGGGIEQMFDKMKKTAAGLFTANKVKELVQNIVQVRGEFQQLEVAFTTMLGSEQKANELMSQLTRTAATTPFDLQGVAQGAKQLLAYGVSADEVNDTLIRCGDVAAGLSIPLNDLVYLYGTTMTQGRMFTQDLRQFQGRGIPIAEELANVLGTTTDKVGELVTAGKVTSEVFKQAFENMTGEGSKFGGLMDAQSKTITGQIANIEDAIDMMFNEIGEKSEGVINTALTAVGNLVENYEEVGRQIGALVVAYGAYKTALIVVTAAQRVNMVVLRQATLEKQLAAAAGISLGNAEAIAAARTKLLAVAQQGLVKTLKSVAASLTANPYVLIGAAVAALAVEIYEWTTAESAAERKTNAVNSAIDDQKKAIEELRSNTQNLISNATDETKSTYERLTAFEALKMAIPGLVEQYKDLDEFTKAMKDGDKVSGGILDSAELDRLKSDAEEWKQIVKDLDVLNEHKLSIGLGWDTVQVDAHELWGMSESEAEAFVSRMKALYGSLGDSIDHDMLKTQAEDLVSAYAEITGKAEGYAQAYESAVQRMGKAKLADEQKAEQEQFERTYDSIDKTQAAIDEYTKKIADLKSEAKGTPLTVMANLMTKEEPQNWLTALRGQIDNLTSWDPLQIKASINVLDLEGTLKRLRNRLEGLQNDNLGKNYDAAKKEYEAAKSELAKINANRGNYTTTDYEKAKTRLNDAKSTYEGLGGNTSTTTTTKRTKSSGESAAERRARIKDAEERRDNTVAKNAQDLKRANEDRANEEQQAYIDTLEDGWAKEQAQRDLNHAKTIQQLEREKEDTVAKLKEAAEAEWDAEENVKKQRNKSYVKQSFDWDSNATEAQKNSVASVESSYDTRIGLQKTANQQDDARALQETLKTYQGYYEQRKALEEKYAKDEKNLKDAGASQDSLNELDYQRTEALDNIDQQFASRSEEFQAWSESIASMSIEKLEEELEMAEQLLEEDGDSGVDPQTLAQARARVAALRKELKKLRSEKDVVNETKPKKATAKDWTRLADAMGECGNSLQSIGDEIGGTVGDIIKTTGTFVSTVSSMIKGIVRLVEISNETMEGTSQAAASAIRTVESASVILAIIEAALQVMQQLMSMFGANYDKYNAEKEAVENLAEVWDDLVSLKQEYISESYGSDAVDAAKDALSYVQKATDAYRQLGRERLNSGASAGSHSIGVRLKKALSEDTALYQSFLQGATAAGVSAETLMAGRMENLFSLSVDQLKALRENAAYFWAKLDDDVREQLEKIIEYGDTAEETANSLVEQLTGISFDSMYDDFVDNLMDMDMSAKDFASDMNETLTKALINNVMGKKYKDLLETWAKSVAQIMKNTNEADRQKQLAEAKAEYAEIVRQAKDEAGLLQEMMGYNATEQQDGTSGGFESMTEDTAEELSGRFTALQVVAQNTFVNVVQIANKLDTSLAIDTVRNTFLQDIITLMNRSTSFLEDIANDTKKMRNEQADNFSQIITKLKTI